MSYESVEVLRGANAPAQNSVFLLDAQGCVLLPLGPSQRAVPLDAAERYPILVGASPGQFSPGRRVDSPQVRAALRLLAAFDRSPMAGLVELSRIDVSSPEVLILTTDQQSEVAVRVEDLERQLNRWRLIYEVGLSQGRRIASLDLSVMENIPLRWQDETPLAPPVSPKIKKTSPYKKRHV